jgi:hypothetical protein
VIEIVGILCFIAGWFAYPLFHVEPDAYEPALDQLAEQLKMVKSVTYRTPLPVEPKKDMVKKPVMRRQWFEDMPAKDDKA